MIITRKRYRHDLQRAEEVGFLSGRLFEIDGFGRNPSALAEKIREVRPLPGSEYQRRYPKELGTERM